MSPMRGYGGVDKPADLEEHTFWSEPSPDTAPAVSDQSTGCMPEGVSLIDSISDQAALPPSPNMSSPDWRRCLLTALLKVRKSHNLRC